MRIELIKKYYESEEYFKKLQVRVNVLKELESNELYRNNVLLDLYATNPLEFIETFGWIIQKPLNNKVVPFFLFEYQKKALIKMLEAENDDFEHEILFDKPREMGLTWLLVWYILWRWLFKPGWSAYVISRREEEVDDGTAIPDNTIFGKFRWGIKSLPSWLKPPGYIPKGSGKGTGTDMKLKIINPNVGTSIVGSSSSSSAGRSRRYNFVFIDECFALENFLDIWKSLQTVSKVKVFVSTTKADIKFNMFSKMCEEKGDRLSFTWKDNPFKDDVWFEEMKKKAELDPEVLKEFEPSYMPSPKSQYYPEISQSKLMPLQFNPKLPLYASFDWGQQDKTVIVWEQFDGKNVLVLDAFIYSGVSPSFYLPFLNIDLEYIEDWYQVDYVKNMLNKIRSWRVSPKWVFGEVAHKQKNVFIEGDKKPYSIESLFRKYGIRFLAKGDGLSHQARRHATSLILPRTIFNSESDGAMAIYNAIANSRYATTVRTGTSKDTILKPVHTPEIADMRAAFENFAYNFARMLRDDYNESGGTREYDDVIKNIYRRLAKNIAKNTKK